MIKGKTNKTISFNPVEGTEGRRERNRKKDISKKGIKKKERKEKNKRIIEIS